MLSPREILAISDEINRKYAPLFLKTPVPTTNKLSLTAAELLGISQEISRKHLPKLKNNRAPLIVQPVDPAHFYVFWNPQALANRSPINPAQRWVLRVSPTIAAEPLQDSHAVEKASRVGNFDIVYEHGQNPQRITMPPGFGDNRFTLSLGTKDNQDRFIPYNTAEKITPASAGFATTESIIEITLPSGGKLPVSATSRGCNDGNGSP
jgi:hypothetical protein